MVYGVVADVFDAIAVAGEVVQTTTTSLDAETLIASMQTELLTNKYASLSFVRFIIENLITVGQRWNGHAC